METFTYPRHAVQQKQMRYSPNLLNVISNAIDNCKVVTIENNSYEKGITTRDIEPMALVYKDRRRNLVGYCRLRNEYRSFILDRLESIKLKQETFTKREDFKLEDFQDDPNATYRPDDDEDFS